MRPIEIKKDIYWVGAEDFGCHNFHGYSVAPRGTTYNAYLVKDEKNVLFDTVQPHLLDALLCRMHRALGGEKLHYLVLNHLELDHAGSAAEIIKNFKPEKVFCSTMGVKSMNGYFDTKDWPVQAVKTGDTLNIGKRNVHFMETRMLHWPDSMFSYIPEDKLLISNDAFGQNYASSSIFADQVERESLLKAIDEYYYNIVLPFSPIVLKVLDSVKEQKLDIDMIAPDHGVIFSNQDVNVILSRYRDLAEQKPKKKALIIYDTMWHSTEKLAYAVGQGLEEVGVPYRIMFLKNHHHSEIMTELANCGAVIAGSPTHNNGVMPLVSAVLCYMKGLKPQNRVGGAFASYGWSGESAKHLHEALAAMGMDMPSEPVKCLFGPDHTVFEAAFGLGKSVGLALLDKIKNA